MDSSLISIGVGSGHSTVGIARLLLGRVDVLVSVSNIAEFILSLILRSIGGSNWSSRNSWGSSSIGGGGNWSSNSWGSSIGGSSNWGSDGWSSSNNWGSRSISGSGNWGSNSWGSSNWSSSKRTSIQSCNWGTIGKLSINSCGSNWGSISSSMEQHIQ